MDEQHREGHEVSFATWASIRQLRSADEVWIHCGWLPCVWWAAIWGRNVHWMPEACYDPVRLHFHGWKKWLVGPIERFCLRRCKTLVATCEAEKRWIEKYLGKRCPVVEVTDIKRFFELVSGGVESGGVAKNSQLITHNSQLHLLYLGRQHPLKGLEYLEEAVKELVVSRQSLVVSEKDLTKSKRETRNTKPETRNIELKIVSNAFGVELEKVWEWCDVLVLPTLSENFGLVVAEALERGKMVITTDGAPAWGDGNDYGGRLIYLKGYRDGTDEERVELLKRAIERICK